jgi:Glucose-6-phosphate dehydrogenase, NAD binding domain
MGQGQPSSDALVFFGATGNLAYKKIFPALQALGRRGKLDFPVVGVAKSGWTRHEHEEGPVGLLVDESDERLLQQPEALDERDIGRRCCNGSGSVVRDQGSVEAARAEARAPQQPTGVARGLQAPRLWRIPDH